MKLGDNGEAFFVQESEENEVGDEEELLLCVPSLPGGHKGLGGATRLGLLLFPGVAALVPLCAQKGSCSRDLTSVKHPERVLDQISSSQTGLPPWAQLLASLAGVLSLGS